MVMMVESRGHDGQIVLSPMDTPPVETPVVAPAPEPSAAETPPADTPPHDEAEAAPDAEALDEAPEDLDEPDTDDAVTVAEHQRKKPRRRPDAEARIKELTAERYDLQRQLDAERRQRDALLDQMLQRHGTQPPAQTTSGTTPQPPPTPAGARPTPDAFEAHEDYLAALMEWQMEQTIARAEERWTATHQAQQAAQAAQTLQQRLDAQFVAGRAHHPDFDQAIQDPSNSYVSHVIPILHEVVAGHPQGHALMYALATDADLRQELNDRTADGARRFLQQQAEALAAPPASPPRPTPPRRVLRPPLSTPIAPVNGANEPLSQDPAAIANRQGSLRDYLAARGTYRP